MDNPENTNPTPETQAPVKKKRGRPFGSSMRKITLKQVIDAVNEAGGVVTDTIALLHMDTYTFYKNWRYVPEVEKALNQAREMGFEKVTDILYKQCLDGDKSAIQLYLRYCPLSKLNQWVDGQTITLKAEKPLTDEEKQNLVKELFG